MRFIFFCFFIFGSVCNAYSQELREPITGVLTHYSMRFWSEVGAKEHFNRNERVLSIGLSTESSKKLLKALKEKGVEGGADAHGTGLEYSADGRRIFCTEELDGEKNVYCSVRFVGLPREVIPE